MKCKKALFGLGDFITFAKRTKPLLCSGMIMFCAALNESKVVKLTAINS